MAYTKQTFVNNSTVLTAEHLEHIEDGIYRNSVAVENSVKTVNGIAPDENGNVEVAGGSGLSTTAKNLLITILNNAVFENDQTSNISALQEALKQSGSAGDNTGGDTGEVGTSDYVVLANGILTILTLANTPIQAQNTLTVL